MSTDRELVELAAKAIGVQKSSPIGLGGDYFIRPGCKFTEWSPLTDDGDALRLAINLRFHVCVNGGDVEVRTDYGTFMEEASDDTYAATRRAIVRAAAEIGRAMP